MRRTQLLRRAIIFCRPMAAPIFRSICVCNEQMDVWRRGSHLHCVRWPNSLDSNMYAFSFICWKQLKPICEWSNFVLALGLMTWFGTVAVVYCVDTPSAQSTDDEIAMISFLCFICRWHCIRIGSVVNESRTKTDHVFGISYIRNMHWRRRHRKQRTDANGSRNNCKHLFRRLTGDQNQIVIASDCIVKFTLK